jgi:predicted metal-binding membrane protein
MHDLSAAQAYPSLFIISWTLMSIAMMLPTSLPIVVTFHTIAAERRDCWLLDTLVVTGYIAAWAAFGGAAYFASAGMQSLALDSIPAVRRFEIPALLAVAGLFQFSSLKYRCLDRCRSPLSFVLSHWQGRRHRRQALWLGISNGMFCVGCCWALMLVMFAFGTHFLAGMLLLGGAMAIEKNMPWGRKAGKPLGGILLLAAIFMVFR